MGQPAFRARFSQRVLHKALGLPPGVSTTIAASLGSEAKARIEREVSSGWVAADDHIALAEAVASVLDEAAYARFWRDVMREELDGPLLRHVVAPIARLFGLTPASLAKHAPTAWPLIVREGGALRFCDLGAGRCELLLEGFSATHLASEPFVRGYAASLEAFLDVSELEGSVSTHDLDLSKPSVRFLFEWSRADRA